MFAWFKNLLKCEVLQPEELVEIEIVPYCCSSVVRISVADESLLLTTAQARKLWGKLGTNLEKMTPDK
jgi:hypothetical protein